MSESLDTIIRVAIESAGLETFGEAIKRVTYETEVSTRAVDAFIDRIATMEGVAGRVNTQQPTGIGRVNMGTFGGGGMGGNPLDRFTTGGANEKIQDPFEAGMHNIQLFTGGMSNLIHTYYWLETAQERMANAQLRLLNAQDRYNSAVEKYGSSSQQAITAHRNLELAINAVDRASAREILNMALVSTQIVMSIGRFGQLIQILTATKTGTDALTVSNNMLSLAQLRVALTNPATMIALAAGGTILGLAYLSNKAQEASIQADRERRGYVPTGHTGAEIIKGGLIEVQAGERVVTEKQSMGTSLQFGDININALSDIDSAFDTQKRTVKTALRRINRW